MRAAAGLEEILADAVAHQTARMLKEYRAAATSSARSSLVATGSAFGVGDLPTPPVPAVGAEALPAPWVQWSLWWDTLAWEEALAEAEWWITRFVIDELESEFAIAVTAEQPFVQGLAAETVNTIEAWSLELKQNVGRIIDQGHRDLMSVKQVAKAIEETGLADLRRATTIARTELVSASNTATYHGTMAIAEPGDMKVWAATSDERTRETHRDADGQRVPFDEPFSVGSSKLMHPGDRKSGAALKELVACRCSWYLLPGD